MNGVFIRKATESDLPAIKMLLQELTSAMNDAEGIDVRAALENCARLLDDGGSHLLVAEIQGTAGGFISFAVRQTLLHSRPSALIDELVVASEYRSKGIGTKLVLAAIEECRQIGCCELEVSTEKTNARAREFYRKCGFLERGILLEADL